MSTYVRRQFALLLIIATVFVAMMGVARAAATPPPNIVSYQGRILNANGVPVSDTSLSVVFRLYDASSGGNCLWSNASSSCASTTARTVTLSSGLFSENLGDTSASYAAIPSTVFSDNATVYLGITIGADSEMSPRKRMTAAPYALNAQTLDGIDSASFLQTGTAIAGASPLIFEGATDDAFETTFAITDPTADRTITFQNASGTVAFLSDISGGGGVFATGTNGDYDNAAVIIGADIAESIENSAFALTAGNLFVTGDAGVEGVLYADEGIGIGPSATMTWNQALNAGHIDLYFPESDGSTNLPVLVIGDASTAAYPWAAAAGLITDPTLALFSDSGSELATLSVDDSGKLAISSPAIQIDANNSVMDIYSTGGSGVASLTGGSDIGIGSGEDLFLNAYGGAVNINSSVNSATNINTGTSSGALTLGGGSGTVAIDSSDWDISTAGAITGVSFDANGSGNSLSNVEGVDIASATITADKLSVMPSDLGAADISLNFSNFNGGYNTSLTLDGTLTAGDFSCTDCLDFSELADNMMLDAPLVINGTGTNAFSVVRTGPAGAVGFGMSTAFTVGAADGSDQSSAFAITATSATSTGSGNTLSGLSIEDLQSPSTGIEESAIAIGGGWTNSIKFLGAVPVFNLADASTLTFTDASANTLATLSDDGSVGSFAVTGDVAINGGDLTTTASTATIFNTNATTIDLGNVSTTLRIGNNDTTSGNAITNTISIGSGAGNTAVNIATDGNAFDTVTIGNSNYDYGHGSSVSVLGQTIKLGDFADNSGSTINIGGVTANGFNTVNIATDSTRNDFISIGNNNATSTLALISGTAWEITATGVIVMGADLKSASATINLFDDTFSDDSTIDLGGVTTDSANTINIATNVTSADTISIGNTHTGTTLALSGGNDWGITGDGALSLGVGGKFTVSSAGIAAVNLSGTVSTNGLCHGGDPTDIAVNRTENIVVCSAAPGDYAEWHETDGTPVQGDIVSLSANTFTYTSTESDAFTGQILEQTTQKTISVLTKAASENLMFGVVSTSPNQTIGSDLKNQGAHPQPIALVGRVPVNVTNENGAIQIGDYVTLSSTPGKGMKATRAGRAIGIALSAFDGTTGTVLVHVTNGWYLGSLIGSDGTSNVLTSDVVIAPVQRATASTTSFDSYGLALRGSAWNGSQDETVSMMFQNVVTDASSYRLSVRNTMDAEVAYITNAGTMQIAGDMIVGGKIYPSNLGGVQTDKYIYYDGSVGPGGDFMRTNASGWSTGSYDFAEMFPSSETLEQGDIVVFSDANIHVKKSTKKGERSIAGIVSTRPGFLAGENTPGSYPIALAGRVPTNVNLENGVIAVGDPLTSSSTPGFAMKATKAGPIAGYALEPFTGTEGKITVFVSAGYWGGETSSQTPGADNRASLFGSSQNESISVLSMTGMINMNGNDITNIGRLAGLADAWSIESDGTIRTEALLKTVIKGYDNRLIETIGVTSPEAIITLSGSSVLKNGEAEVRFVDVSKDFPNIISAIAPIRVVATPNGPVSLYVSEKDQNHFVVKSFGGNGTDIAFDWVVTAYRKGYELVEEAPSANTQTSAPQVSAPSNSSAPAAEPVVETGSAPQTESPVAAPAAEPSPAPVTETPVSVPEAPVTVEPPAQAPDTSGSTPASSTSSSTTSNDSSEANADASASTSSS